MSMDVDVSKSVREREGECAGECEAVQVKVVEKECDRGKREEKGGGDGVEGEVFIRSQAKCGLSQG